MHVVSVCLHYGNIISLPWQRPLTKWKIRYRSIICRESAFIWWNNCENLFSISRDIRLYTRCFWPCHTRRTQISPVISRVTRQKLTKFLDDVAPSSLLLTRTDRPWYCMATSLKISEKRRAYRSSVIHYLPFGVKIVKIGAADPEILGLWANVSGTKPNWLPWQRPLRYRKKFQIYHLHPKRFHTV